MSEAQYRNRICILFSVTPNSPKQRGANGKFSPSHGYFPAGKFRYPTPSRSGLAKLRFSPSFSICDIKFKTNEPKFWQILSPKIVCQNFVHLFRHLPEYLYGQNTKENVLSIFKKISPPPNQESKEHFSLVLPREARQWRNDTSVRFSFKPPRTRGVISHLLGKKLEQMLGVVHNKK